MFAGQVTPGSDLSTRNVSTSVTMTSLADTKDFEFLHEDFLGSSDSGMLSWNLQDFIALVNTSESQGVSYINETDLHGNATQRNDLPLERALDELFQNVTISLMSFLDLR
jgi:hypothetical protein